MIKRKIYGVLFVLVLCFIWGNSILSKEISHAISSLVASVMGGGSGSGEEGHHIVRKLAHFIEFAALGATGHLFFESLMQDKHKRYITLALIGVATPLIDETIQIFSGRGPALSDVWIDIAGYTLGALVVFGAFYLVSKVIRREQSQA